MELRVVVEHDPRSVHAVDVALVDLVAGEEVEIGFVGRHPFDEIVVGEPDAVPVPGRVRGDVLHATHHGDPDRTIGRRLVQQAPSFEGAAVDLAHDAIGPTEMLVDVGDVESGREAPILERRGADGPPCPVTGLQFERDVADLVRLERGAREPRACTPSSPRSSV